MREGGFFSYWKDFRPVTNSIRFKDFCFFTCQYGRMCMKICDSGQGGAQDDDDDDHFYY